MLSPKDHGTMRDRLIMHIEHKLDEQDQMKSRRKTRIKGITELVNILTVRNYSFTTCTVYMALVDMSGDTSVKISAQRVDR